jgi:glycosyltransferase involved in cell wall biosynthesis
MKSDEIIFLATTGAWWDHRYYHKQMPALIKAGFSLGYWVREDPTIKDNSEIKITQLSKRQCKTARITGGLNLLRKVVINKPKAVQICNVELLPLGILLSVFFRMKVFYDCREDHFNAMLHSKVWFPLWARYILAYNVAILEFISSFVFTGFIDSDPAIYNGHKYVRKHKKMIFYNMPLKSQFFAARKKNVEKNDVVVLGSMSIRTGVLNVIEAIALLKSKGEKLRLKLVGDPTFDKILWDKAKRIIDENELHEQVKVTGRMPYDQIPIELMGCKVGVIPLLDLPKFRNNIATKQFEYMASGIAVISSDLPPQRHFIKEGINGVFYNPGDVDELADKLLELLNNEVLIERISTTGKKYILEEWNAEHQQSKYIEFYKNRLQGIHFLENQLPPIELPK